MENNKKDTYDEGIIPSDTPGEEWSGIPPFKEEEDNGQGNKGNTLI